MKLEQLRKVIREEVKNAVREELQEVLNEAVRVASTPDIDKHLKQLPAQKHNIYSENPIQDILEEIRQSTPQQGSRTSYTGNTVGKPNFASTVATNMGMSMQESTHPGLDISKFDFIKNAGEAYKKSVQLDKERLGIN